jgi:two-component system LytT family response regulator
MENSELKAVIVEDERESLELIKDLIDSGGKAKVIGSTSNPDEAVSLISTLEPDIVFLDIKMPGKSGFDILDELSRLAKVTPYIVFTTAYDEFAVKAFEYAAFDYLLKPIDPSRLSTSIIRCSLGKKTGSAQNSELLRTIMKKLIYRNISGIVIIDPSEVVYVEAAGNYSCFQLNDGKKETVTISLGKVEEHLMNDGFFRTGRTYIINLNYLKKINSKKRECILHSGGVDFRCEISYDKIKVLLDRLKGTS